MNFNGNFIQIGAADVTPIVTMINKLNDTHWQHNIPQEQLDAPRQIESIHLVHDADFRHMNPTKHPALEVFGPIIQPLLAYIAEFYEKQPANQALIKEFGPGYFIRANIIKLKAGGSVTESAVKNFSASHSHHIHIPIITHDDIHFTIGDQTFNITQGEILELNNHKTVTVNNNSATDMIHLMLDFVIPNET